MFLRLSATVTEESRNETVAMIVSFIFIQKMYIFKEPKNTDQIYDLKKF